MPSLVWELARERRLQGNTYAEVGAGAGSKALKQMNRALNRRNVSRRMGGGGMGRDAELRRAAAEDASAAVPAGSRTMDRKRLEQLRAGEQQEQLKSEVIGLIGRSRSLRKGGVRSSPFKELLDKEPAGADGGSFASPVSVLGPFPGPGSPAPGSGGAGGGEVQWRRALDDSVRSNLANRVLQELEEKENLEGILEPATPPQARGGPRRGMLADIGREYKNLGTPRGADLPKYERPWLSKDGPRRTKLGRRGGVDRGLRQHLPDDDPDIFASGGAARGRWRRPESGISRHLSSADLRTAKFPAQALRESDRRRQQARMKLPVPTPGRAASAPAVPALNLTGLTPGAAGGPDDDEDDVDALDRQVRDINAGALGGLAPPSDSDASDSESDDGDGEPTSVAKHSKRSFARTKRAMNSRLETELKRREHRVLRAHSATPQGRAYQMRVTSELLKDLQSSAGGGRRRTPARATPSPLRASVFRRAESAMGAPPSRVGTPTPRTQGAKAAVDSGPEAVTGAAEYAAAFVEHCETLNHSDPLLIFLQRKLKTLLRTECDVDIDLLERLCEETGIFCTIGSWTKKRNKFLLPALYHVAQGVGASVGGLLAIIERYGLERLIPELDDLAKEKQRNTDFYVATKFASSRALPKI